MKKKSINELDAQFGRIHHFGTYQQTQKALKAVNRYRLNIFNHFGVEFCNNRPCINGQELTDKEKIKLYRRKVSAKIYTK